MSFRVGVLGAKFVKLVKKLPLPTAALLVEVFGVHRANNVRQIEGTDVGESESSAEKAEDATGVPSEAAEEGESRTFRHDPIPKLFNRPDSQKKGTQTFGALELWGSCAIGMKSERGNNN